MAASGGFRESRSAFELDVVEATTVGTDIAKIGEGFEPTFEIGPAVAVEGGEGLFVSVFHVFEKLGEETEAHNLDEGVERNAVPLVFGLEVADER